MEENLLNELENFTSIKYLDDVTNNCSNDDEQVCEKKFILILNKNFSLE